MQNAGSRASKLSFEILLAERYLLYVSCQSNELKHEIKHTTGGPWPTLGHPLELGITPASATFHPPISPI